MTSSVETSAGKCRILLALAPIVFAILIWAGWLLPQRPYSGIGLVAQDGTIESIMDDGPAAEAFEVGDVIVRVNGMPWVPLRNDYVGKHAGDSVPFVVERDGEMIDVSVTLVKYPSARLFGGIAPLLLAFSFAVAGTLVLLFVPSDPSRLYFLNSHAAAAALGFALIGALRHPWGNHLFYILLWLVGPLTVHLHLNLLQKTDSPGWKLLLKILYTVAALGGLPFVFISPATVHTLSWYSVLYSAARLYVAATVIFAVGILVVATSRGASAAALRRKLRPLLVAGGGVLLLFIGLTILPDALGSMPILPYRLAFLMMLVLPLAYGYTIASRPGWSELATKA